MSIAPRRLRLLLINDHLLSPAIMSQFFSNKYLRYRGLDQRQPQTIERDRPCSRCGYNLRGLMNNSNCPECGSEIRTADAPRHIPLSDTSLRDIRRFALGLWLGIACVGLIPAASFFLATAMGQVGRSMQTSLSSVVVILCCLWFAAVWFMTPSLESAEGRRYGFAPASQLRRWARWSQAAWIVPIAVVSVAGPSIVTYGLIILAVLVGLGGLVALSLMLSRLADWALDETAAKLLNVTVWLLPAATACVLVTAMFSTLRFVSVLASLAWFTGLVAFGIALICLAASTSWSIRHARDRLDREAALKERAKGAHATRPQPGEGDIRLAQPGDPLPSVGLADTDTSTHAFDSIDRDTPCGSCGYNLRGLKVYGRCPECGERIASA